MPRVLVIDDSRATRAHLIGVLEAAGWEVIAEANGEQGAATALSNPPDVVISDLWMPGLSGLQLCRLLHEDAATSNVPVVLMSASLDRRSRFWAEQSGAKLTLDKKAFAATNVHETLSGLLTARSGQQAPKTQERVTANAIPMRLSHLLDRALFESVVAKELRSLAMASSVNAFFDGLVELLGRILAFRWLALATSLGEQRIVWIQSHPQEKDDVVAEARHALGCGDDWEQRIIIDDRGRTDGSERSVAGSASSSVMVLDIVAGAQLGRVGIRGYEATMSAVDRDLLELVQHELPLALRAVLLAEETRRLASTDMLTGLWNRRQAVEVLEQAIAGSKRYGHPVSVMMIDIDFFKKINDTYGHNSGDLALKHVAGIIRRTCRKADAAARWGGEEFLVIMPFTGTAGARVAAERVRAAVAAGPAVLEGGKEADVTVSVGAATESPTNFESLVSRADRALYLAKSRGRNRVELG